MIEILRSNPLLLLFLVAAIGYPLGYVRIGGNSLGVAAVLFVGLAFGALSPDLKLPEIVYQLGLVLFVYAIGLSSGPGFFRALRRKGLRDNLLVGAMLLMAAALAVGIYVAIGLPSTQVAGLFAGSLTNTPALAAVLEYVRLTAPPELREQLLNEPTVGYSIAYPVGVMGVILLMGLLPRLWKVDYAAEARELQDLGATSEELVNRTIRVTRPDAGATTVSELIRGQVWRVIFVRQKHGAELALVDGGTHLAVGDLVSVVGSPAQVEKVESYLGEPASEQLELDRSRIDFRRIFVSSHEAAGRSIGDMHLPERYGALITRVRRGDNELLPTADTVLELGDRVRVVALRNRMDGVRDFFGDSYRALSEIDFLTFSLGLVLGLLIGLIPIPLPGGGSFRLGIAGGPLIAGLVLSALERTGSLVWSIPYSANLTIRQIGLVLFLAAIGTRSGYAFASTLASSGGLVLFLSGALITCATAAMTLWVGYRLLRTPMSLLLGMMAGLQTNPAVLSYATQQTHNDIPNIGYTTVYPLATIMKIVLAQLLIALLP